MSDDEIYCSIINIGQNINSYSAAFSWLFVRFSSQFIGIIIISTVDYSFGLLVLIMMIAPNSLARQKEGFQGEEEEAGDQRKGGQIGTPTPCVDTLTDLSRSGVLHATNKRNHGRWYGVPLRGT